MKFLLLSVFFLLAVLGLGAPAQAAVQGPAATASVTVTVRDAAGRLVPGARIEVRQGVFQNLIQVRSTNAQGQVTLTNLPVGSNYSIKALAGSHVYTWYGSLRAGVNPPIAMRFSIWR